MSSEQYPNSLLSSLVGLHAIDFEDVALTMEGFADRTNGCADCGPAIYAECGLRQADVVSGLGAFLLTDCIGDERSGGLIMCTDMVKKSLCLPIPREYWMVRKYRGDRVQ